MKNAGLPETGCSFFLKLSVESLEKLRGGAYSHCERAHWTCCAHLFVAMSWNKYLVYELGFLNDASLLVTRNQIHDGHSI